MKFSVSQSALSKALAIVSKAMGTNSTLPILSGVFMRVQDQQLELQTSDLAISIKHHIPANVSVEGTCVVSGKMIMSIVKSLPDAAILFELEDRQLVVNCGDTTFKLRTLSSEDWPEFPELNPEVSIDLPSNLLNEMVNKVYKVASREKSYPVLQGIQLTVADNTIRLVATDAYRVAVCDSHCDTTNTETFQAIIPATVFHDVLGMTDNDENFTIGTTNNQIIFKCKETQVISRNIQGNFPDYRILLFKNTSSVLTINVNELSSCMKRVSVINQHSPMYLNLDKDTERLRLLTTTTDQEEASEELSVKVEGNSFMVRLLPNYIFDCLSAISEEKEVFFEVQMENPQLVAFKSPGKVNLLYILPPLQASYN